MNSIVVAALYVLGTSLPLVFLFSTPRRMLSFVRDEAKTLDALPEDHPSRKALAKEIKSSVKAYTNYSSRQSSRDLRKIIVVGYMGTIAGIAAVYLINREILGETKPVFDDQFFTVVAWLLKAVTSIFLLMALVGVIGLTLEYAKRMRKIKKKLAKESARQRAKKASL